MQLELDAEGLDPSDRSGGTEDAAGGYLVRHEQTILWGL